MNKYFHSVINRADRKDFNIKVLNNYISLGLLLQLQTIITFENKDGRDEV